MLVTTWFVLWGLLWAAYFMLDGFDLGLGALMPWLAKDENDRAEIYRSIGPFWDGNEVWLVAAGGVTFAAFPLAYAVLFSSLYSALMLILFSLIIRGAGLGLLAETDHPGLKKVWNWCLITGSTAAGILFGVAFANIFRGVPIDSDGALQGNLLTLLNPYGIIGGALFIVLFMTHGLIWLAAKTDGELKDRAARLAKKFWVVLAALALLFLAGSGIFADLWSNYLGNPILLLIPLIAVVALVISRVYLQRGNHWHAWFASCVFIVMTTFFGLVGIFPMILPSTLDPGFSIFARQAASSELTLKIMLGVALVFVPLVVAYQGWTYWTFKDKQEG